MSNSCSLKYSKYAKYCNRIFLYGIMLLLVLYFFQLLQTLKYPILEANPIFLLESEYYPLASIIILVYFFGLYKLYINLDMKSKTIGIVALCIALIFLFYITVIHNPQQISRYLGYSGVL